MQDLTGCVGFSVPIKPGLIGKGIQFFTHGKWTHTFVVIGGETDTGRPLIIEAGWLQVLITKLDKYFSGEYELRFYRPRATFQEVKRAIGKSIDLTEIQYGYLQFIGFIPIWLWKKLTGKKIANPITNGVICSELSYVYVDTIGIDKGMTENLDKDSIDPVFLDRLLARSDKWSEVDNAP